MTDSDQAVGDCPETCACYGEGYAHGKDKAHLEVRSVLDPNHPESCGCEPCNTVRAVLRRKLTARARPFRQVEVQDMNGHAY